MQIFQTPQSILSSARWNVETAVLSSNNTRKYRKDTRHFVKVVISRSSSATGICQWPDFDNSRSFSLTQKVLAGLRANRYSRLHADRSMHRRMSSYSAVDIDREKEAFHPFSIRLTSETPIFYVVDLTTAALIIFVISAATFVRTTGH